MVLNTFVLTLNPFHTDSANLDLIRIVNPDYRMVGNFDEKIFWRIAEIMSTYCHVAFGSLRLTKRRLKCLLHCLIRSD